MKKLITGFALCFLAAITLTSKGSLLAGSGFLFQEQAVQASAAGDYFGSAVTISANTAVISEWGPSCNEDSSFSYHLFNRGKSNLWTFDQELCCTETVWGHCDMSGDIAAIPSDHENGRLHIFRRDASSGLWDEEAVLYPEGIDCTDLSSKRVSVSGNSVACGTYHCDALGDGVGAVVIYRYDSTAGWYQDAVIFPEDPVPNTYFGGVKQLHNDLLAVTTQDERVHIYRRSDDQWTKEGELQPKTLGSIPALAISDQMIAVGLPWATPDMGKVNIYRNEEKLGWQLEQVIVPAEQSQPSRFGSTLATFDTLLIVGDSYAPEPPDCVDCVQGGAYVFRWNDGFGWIEETILKGIFNPAGGGGFASEDAVDIYSSDVIIGADGLDNDNGVAFTYHLEGLDCNSNGISDEVDIKSGLSYDCNRNLIPDECDIDNDLETDCNQNGIPDPCDIDDGLSQDINGDDVPDECQCLADASFDGIVDTVDLLIVIAAWETTGPIGDVNFDGIVNVVDLLIVIDNWGPCE